MMNSDLPDLLAARAAGEDAPDIDPAEVDRRLSESQAARDELDGLTGLVSLLRAQQGAPDARRLAQLDLALDRQTRPSPWPRRLAMAAAVLLTVGLLVSGLYWDLRLRSHRTPAVAVTPKVPSHSSPQPPAPHAWLEQLVTDVHVAPPRQRQTVREVPGLETGAPPRTGTPGGPPTQRGNPGDPGKRPALPGNGKLAGPGTPSGAARLRLSQLPKGFRLESVKRVPRHTTGQPFDCSWTVYKARIGRIVLVQAPGTAAARTYLAGFVAPRGWARALHTTPGTCVLLLSQCCTEDALASLRDFLTPTKQ